MIIFPYHNPGPLQWRVLLILLASLLVAYSLSAQDLNRSATPAVESIRHPALTGLQLEGWELGGRYRQQWVLISPGYHSADAQLRYRSGQWSWGAQFWSLRAPQQQWQYAGVGLQLAYQQALSADGQHLAAGLRLSGAQWNYGNSYTYDQQYVDGLGFNSNLPSGEAAGQETVRAMDWSASVAWVGADLPYRLSRWMVATTFSHLNPSITEAVTSGHFWPRHLSVDAQWTAMVGRQYALTGRLVLQQQQGHRNTQLGLTGWIPVQSDQQLWLAWHYRLADAQVWQVGYQTDRIQCWVAYDWNTSSLSHFTNGQGALELGATYRWDKGETTKPRQLLAQSAVLPEAVEKTQDQDGDGVPDALDRCPFEYGYPPYQGCRDQDMDGVIDPEDSCPLVYGPPARHGCPSNSEDVDRDGIKDLVDRCPFIPGEARFGGCPDTDGDDIPDTTDDCPYFAASTSKGGCPEHTSVSEGSTQELVLYFDVDQAELTTTHLQQLEEWWRSQLPGQANNCIIAGHTDQEGTSLYNHHLGQARAQAVWTWLANKPSSPHAQLFSYGELMPAVEGAGATAASLNRRVVIQVQ